MLTKEEVKALPSGTDITIIWSGGNGPHDYILLNYAGHQFTIPRYALSLPLSFLGIKQPFTQVKVKEWKDE